MPKYLIVNSDDFGISEGVSRGILEAHHQGIVTSTTVMVNMPAAALAIEQAQKEAPELGMGLHFNLSFGVPIRDDVPSLLTDAGTFVSDYQPLMDKLASFEPDEVKRELQAQFLRFIDLAGHPPDHLDSHHGVTYFYPAAVEAMLDLAREYHLPIRSFPYERISAQDAQLAEQIRAIVEAHGKPRQPARMLDPVFDFKQGDRVERLKASLRNVPDGYSEMLCHVGYADGLTESYTTQREEELAAFTDPAVKALVVEEGIQLITFADLPA